MRRVSSRPAVSREVATPRHRDFRRGADVFLPCSFHGVPLRVGVPLLLPSPCKTMIRNARSERNSHIIAAPAAPLYRRRILSARSIPKLERQNVRVSSCRTGKMSRLTSRNMGLLECTSTEPTIALVSTQTPPRIMSHHELEI